MRIHGSEKAIDNNILFSKDGNYLVFARPHRSRERTLRSTRPRLPVPGRAPMGRTLTRVLVGEVAGIRHGTHET